MAGGQRIDDYKGMPRSSDELMRSSNKVKHYASAKGDGALADYWDTTEKIHEQQVMGDRKAKGHAQKPGYRN